jgi:hypothetical protein
MRSLRWSCLQTQLDSMQNLATLRFEFCPGCGELAAKCFNVLAAHAIRETVP